MRKTTWKRLLPILIGIVLLCCMVTACGDSDTEECSHSFGKWKETEAATCTEKGTETRKCEDCGEKETRDIDIVEHTEEVDEARAATCTQEGHTEGKHCSVCDKVLKKQEKLPMLEHVYEESVIVEASCANNGKKEFSCANCDASYLEDFSMPVYTANEIYELTKDSIGEIIIYDKNGESLALGTGVVYTEDGQILTNYHVIDGAYSAEITISARKYQLKQVLAYDKQIDLAILQIDAKGLQPIPICKNEHAVGKEVYAFGSSLGLTETFSQGIITNARRDVGGIEYVQHDAAISGGNSGGPLINQYGELVGINTWTVAVESQNLNFAILPEEIDNLVFIEPLTVKEFYEKECNAFVRLKNHIMENGEYDAADGTYSLQLGTDYSDDYINTFTREIFYSVNEDVAILYCYYNTDVIFAIEIDDIDGIYQWLYVDVAGNVMKGMINGATHTLDSILVCDESYVYDTQTEVLAIATVLADYLLVYIDEDLSAVDITAADLGFVNF